MDTQVKSGRIQLLLHTDVISSAKIISTSHVLCSPPLIALFSTLLSLSLSIFHTDGSIGRVMGLAVASVCDPAMKVCYIFTDVKALVLSDLLYTAVTSVRATVGPQSYTLQGVVTLRKVVLQLFILSYVGHLSMNKDYC